MATSNQVTSLNARTIMLKHFMFQIQSFFNFLLDFDVFSFKDVFCFAYILLAFIDYQYNWIDNQKMILRWSFCLIETTQNLWFGWENNKLIQNKKHRFLRCHQLLNLDNSAYKKKRVSALETNGEVSLKSSLPSNCISIIFFSQRVQLFLLSTTGEIHCKTFFLFNYMFSFF